MPLPYNAETDCNPLLIHWCNVHGIDRAAVFCDWGITLHHADGSKARWNTEYIIWIQARWAEWREMNGYPECFIDQRAFAKWLRSAYPEGSAEGLYYTEGGPIEKDPEQLTLT